VRLQELSPRGSEVFLCDLNSHFGMRQIRPRMAQLGGCDPDRLAAHDGAWQISRQRGTALGNSLLPAMARRRAIKTECRPIVDRSQRTLRITVRIVPA